MSTTGAAVVWHHRWTVPRVEAQFCQRRACGAPAVHKLLIRGSSSGEELYCDACARLEADEMGISPPPLDAPTPTA